MCFGEMKSGVNSNTGVSVSAVIPQHCVDSSLSSNNEELKPAVYYERLKILRQRQGLENTSRVSLLTHTHYKGERGHRGQDARTFARVIIY